MNELNVQITSVPDRENLVAEIWLKDIMIAEVNHELKKLEVQIYCKKNILTVDYENLLKALNEAKEKLTGLSLTLDVSF